MLCYALLYLILHHPTLYYTTLNRINRINRMQGWATLLNFHEDLCERNGPGGCGYPPKNVSSTEEQPLTANSSLELYAAQNEMKNYQLSVNLNCHLDHLGLQYTYICMFFLVPLHYGPCARDRICISVKLEISKKSPFFSTKG